MRGAARLEALVPHAARLVDQRLQQLIAADPGRTPAMTLQAGPLFACFARQRVDHDALAALFALAGDLSLPEAIDKLFAGEQVNPSERRAALHTALRGDPCKSAPSAAARAEAIDGRRRMSALVDALRDGKATDIINIGIGGSDLGPRLVVDALAPPDGLRVHFLANVDAHAAQRLLRRLDPSRTAAVVVSKSFGTQETLANAAIVRDWMGADAAARTYAVSAKTDRAVAFGIQPGHVLPMWDWVGGRYSLWSSVGFAIALAIGNDAFDQLLAGAAELDAHVYTMPPARNLAMWHALLAVWNRNALGLDTQAVIPYDERLQLLPAFLQQLVMESLGKSVDVDGTPVQVATSPVVWGGAGTGVQHSFFQSLHQGTDTVPVDFIGVVAPDHGHRHSHDILLANLLAQAQSLANGQDSEDPQRRYPGGRPSTMILLEQLDARSLGALLALYEHSVYLQSVVWGINAFDQWGVELGKRIADGLLPAVTGSGQADDPVTASLLERIRAGR